MTEVTALETLDAALREAAAYRLDPTPTGQAAIRALVFDAVAELKTMGLPPERVIVSIKTIANDAGVDRNREDLRQRIVSWAIEAYFQPDSLTP